MVWFPVSLYLPLQLHGLFVLVLLGSLRCSVARTYSQYLRKLNTEAVGQIEDFYLIDADTEMPIQLLRNGSVINTVMLATSNFNIEARVTNGIVRSIRFGYNNIFNYRIENE
jgi:hypothetical protein